MTKFHPREKHVLNSTSDHDSDMSKFENPCSFLFENDKMALRSLRYWIIVVRNLFHPPPRMPDTLVISIPFSRLRIKTVMNPRFLTCPNHNRDVLVNTFFVAPKKLSIQFKLRCVLLKILAPHDSVGKTVHQSNSGISCTNFRDKLIYQKKNILNLVGQKSP